MRNIQFLITVLSLYLAQACTANADQPRFDRVGDVYEITMRQEREQQADGRVSGSSTSGMALSERIVERRQDGLVLEYDRSPPLSAEERVIDW